jgi:DNA-directed RNA polymerase alpha subunit
VSYTQKYNLTHLKSAEIQKLRDRIKTLELENKILGSQLEKLAEIQPDIEKMKKTKSDFEEDISQLKRKYDEILLLCKLVPVSELNLSSRVKSILENRDVSFVSESSCLIELSYSDFRYLGKKSITEIKAAIIDYYHS